MLSILYAGRIECNPTGIKALYIRRLWNQTKIKLTSKCSFVLTWYCIYNLQSKYNRHQFREAQSSKTWLWLICAADDTDIYCWLHNLRYIEIPVFITFKTDMIAIHIGKDLHRWTTYGVWYLILIENPNFSKSIKNIRKDGNIVEAETETVIAFRKCCLQRNCYIKPKNSVKKKNYWWAYHGMKDIEVTPLGINKTRVDVQWDITVKVFFGLFRGRVKKHIPQGTWDALDRISTTVT